MPGLADAVAGKIRAWTGKMAAVEPLSPGEAHHASALAACRAIDKISEAQIVSARPGSAARAVGLAAIGVRVTWEAVGGELAEAAALLGQAASRHIALVVRATDGEADPAVAAALTAAGVLVAKATTAQQAADLLMIARHVAEGALVPAVVLLQGQAASEAEQDLLMPTEQLILEWLGHPGDLVDAPTPAQALLFGPQRARLPGRFSLTDPMAIGAVLPLADRPAGAAAADIFFGAHVAQLSAQAATKWLEITGRSAAALLSAAAPRSRDDTPQLSAATAFPQREVMLQAVARDYPAAIAGRPTSTAAKATALPAGPGPSAGHLGGSAAQGRFWGEFLQPRLAGEGEGQCDPWLAACSVPRASARLFDRSSQREQVPQLDLERCTGCGTCWAACPDSALAPVALGAQAWLDAAGDRASAGKPRSPAGDRLRRLHKQISARLEDDLARTGGRTIAETTLLSAYAWAADRAILAEDERAAVDAAFAATAREALRLDVAATTALFHAPHKLARGSGLLLSIAVDPRACQDCGVCAAVCGEQAILSVPQTPTLLDALRDQWLAWEQTPDTTGAAMAKASAACGELAALLLSRHGQRAVAGADAAEPGSGQRLAARWLTAVLEQQRQTRVIAAHSALQALSANLDAAIQAGFAKAAPSGDHEALLAALQRTWGRTAPLREVADRLAAQGLGTSVDASQMRRLAEAAVSVDALRSRQDDARFGVVLAGPSSVQWAGQFPRNPFDAPVYVDGTPNALDVALGLAQGSLNAAVDVARTWRSAELALQAPPDWQLQLAALADLTAADLSPQEWAHAWPLLVLADRQTLQGAGLAAMFRVLASGLPIKVLLADDCGNPDDVDVVAAALTQRQAYVAATSIAHPLHLRTTVVEALACHGPALIAVHTPSPQHHGFAPADLIARAELAVAARVHPLLRYQPGGNGGLAQRLSLDGNPAVSARWATDGQGAEITPTAFLAGERRFANSTAAATRQLTDSLALRWATLQDLAAVAGPQVSALKGQIQGELEAAHAAELAALQARHAAELSQREAAWRAAAAAAIRQQIGKAMAASQRTAASGGPA